MLEFPSLLSSPPNSSALGSSSSLLSTQENLYTPTTHAHEQCFEASFTVPMPAMGLAAKGILGTTLSPLRMCTKNSDCPPEYQCQTAASDFLTETIPDLFDFAIYGTLSIQSTRMPCSLLMYFLWNFMSKRVKWSCNLHETACI
jgi:hypothetical protein